MKKAILLLFILFSNLVFCQNLPKLQLRDAVIEDTLVNEKIDKDEICVIIKSTGGSFAHDTYFYFFFKSEKKINAYIVSTPKSYLKKNKKLITTIDKTELSLENEKLLFLALNSNQTAEFLNFTQSDFKNITNEKERPCLINDASGCSMTFIQNGKQNTYYYHAPKYMLEKCNNKSINKVTLEKYIQLLDLWQVNNLFKDYFFKKYIQK
ncbi:hypothetical protein [Flavobacterium terrigena]|uniref:Uncharacterized protein n=1 Tax=Flavobacterium terrigena TaxID=402734 RepID=A0A1H6UIJ0_9FLAO|nr:hypothetical protein [Flavobacterium terrigena]SEI88010.1 hypothetical protein SAMN05660918_1796 [Flavobacterium terrigena]